MNILQKLKQDLTFTTELMDLLEILKSIAMWEFRELEKKKQRFSQFMDAFSGFFQMIDFSSVSHPFTQQEGTLGIVVITSDEGFMRGLNNWVVTKALELEDKEKALFIVLGEKGADYLRSYNKEFYFFKGRRDYQPYELSLRLKDYLIERVLSGKLAKIMIVYPKPISFMVHTVDVVKILPCWELFNLDKKRSEQQDIIKESSLESIIEQLIELWVTQKLFEVIEDSRLAEFSARTMHLEESHYRLEGQKNNLQYQFLRGRREYIDHGMRDILCSRIGR